MRSSCHRNTFGRFDEKRPGVTKSLKKYQTVQQLSPQGWRPSLDQYSTYFSQRSKHSRYVFFVAPSSVVSDWHAWSAIGGKRATCSDDIFEGCSSVPVGLPACQRPTSSSTRRTMLHFVRVRSSIPGCGPLPVARYEDEEIRGEVARAAWMNDR